jgi:diguanylate cyclase (GGDEF)-like protein/PAS domain S-box-containing protein
MAQSSLPSRGGLTRRFRRAALLLIAPLVGVALVAGASLLATNAVSDSLRQEDDTALVISTIQAELRDLGLYATAYLIDGNGSDYTGSVAAMTAVTDQLATLSRARQSTTSMTDAVTAFASAWNSGASRTSLNSIARSGGHPVQVTAAFDGSLDAEISSLNAGIDAIDELNAAEVRHLQHDQDVVALAAAIAVALALVIGSAVAWAVSGNLSRSVLRPLAGLTAATSDLASGRSDQRVLIAGDDELAILGTRFNVMADQLEARAETIAQRERRTLALVEYASDGILVVDQDGQVIFVTPTFSAEFGALHGGEAGALAEIIHPDDLEQIQRAWARLLTDKLGSTLEIESRLRRADGEWRHVWARLTNLMEDPAVGGMVLNVSDVTERREYEARLSYQALHDPLTGMANRTLLRSRLDHMATQDWKEHDSVALLYLDLDDFKQVNDTMGHDAGDQVLQHVATTLVSVVRPQDIVARLGGDEFAILLEDASAADADAAAARVVAALCVPFVVEGKEVRTAASVGIARGRGRQVAETLFGDADLAMYFAKREGKSTHKVYLPAMRTAVVDRLALGADLRRAVTTGEISNHYQPVVEVGSGRIVGAEALARWQHPERGSIGPNIFIPLAEEIGLVYEIDKLVLRRACLQARRWIDDGVPGFKMAVNLSSIDLDQGDIVAVVAEALRDSGLPAANLELEVTESVAITEFDRAENTLDELKALGVSLAIDDFGTGYSALALLRRMPFDRLKIDKSFVDEVGGDLQGPTLVEAILDIARVLGMKVVAEGVEHTGQARFLEDQRCDFAQGFLFSRPVPAQAFTDLLRSHAALGMAAA